MEAQIESFIEYCHKVKGCLLYTSGVSRNEIEAAFAEAAEKGDGPDELALARMWLAKKRCLLYTSRCV